MSMNETPVSERAHIAFFGCRNAGKSSLLNAVTGQKMAIVSDGRHAVTHYEVIARYPGYTHVRCRLETGRTHQIRVHMASLGHPIAGDEVYGPSKSRVDLGGQCLHARCLRFLHPADGEPRLVESQLPAYFQTFLDKLERMS